MYHRWRCKDTPDAHWNLELGPEDVSYSDVVQLMENEMQTMLGPETHKHIFSEWTFAVHPEVNQGAFTTIHACPGKNAV